MATVFGDVGWFLLFLMLVFVCTKAWQETATRWPLDTEFPDNIRNLWPFEPRWLTVVFRVFTFPLVMLTYTVIAALLLAFLLYIVVMVISLHNAG